MYAHKTALIISQVPCKLYRYVSFHVKGYVAELALPGKESKVMKLLVCSSCARAMRGRCKLEKIEQNVDFACAMGSG